MWDSAVAFVVNGVVAAFSWMGQIFDAVPGSWNTVFTIIVILILSRFLLGPLLGAAFIVGSDTVRAHKNKAEFNRRTRESYHEMKHSKGN